MERSRHANFPLNATFGKHGTYGQMWGDTVGCTVHVPQWCVTLFHEAARMKDVFLMSLFCLWCKLVQLQQILLTTMELTKKIVVQFLRVNLRSIKCYKSGLLAQLLRSCFLGHAWAVMALLRISRHCIISYTTTKQQVKKKERERENPRWPRDNKKNHIVNFFFSSDH